MPGEEAQLEYEVASDDCYNFAKLFRDWNLLHTDLECVVSTIFGCQVMICPKVIIH